MAFGFPPRYSREIDAGNITPSQFVVLGLQAVKTLKWNVGLFNESGFTATTGFSLSSFSEQVVCEIIDGKIFLASECLASQVVDWGKNEKNINDFLIQYQLQKDGISDEHFSVALADHERELSLQENNLTQQQINASGKKRKGFLWLFVPTQDFFVTPILIDINILVFLAMVISGVNVMLPSTDDLLTWGANFRPYTIDGQWWRLITCCFLHIGVLHLLFNMYALLYIGLYLEPLMGKLNFAVAYLLTGILSSVTSLYWHSLTISAGASGAIFGLYGVFLAMLTTDMIERSARKTLLTSISIFVGYNLLNGLSGSIDNAAHIGGLISGLAIGYVFYPILTNAYSAISTGVVISILSLVTFGTSLYVYKTAPDELVLYQNLMKEFATNESLAMEVYSRNPDRYSKDDLMNEIQNRGIFYWNENEKILRKIDHFHLPEVFQKRNKILTDYCDLRVKVFNLLYKGLLQDTDKYAPEIEVANKQIEKIVEGIKQNNQK